MRNKRLSAGVNIPIQDSYQPPSLEWYQILRGSEDGGNTDLKL